MEQQAQVSDYIDELASPQKDVCEQLRQLISETCPGADERWSWSRPCYAASVGGKLFCYLVANKSDVNLGFQNGADLDDPAGRVEGTGINMRHVKIRDVGEIDLDYFRGLLTQALGLAAGG